MKNNKQSFLQRNLKEQFFLRISKPEAFPLLAFLIPLVIRAIPEILMGPYMVGFDTLGYYVPNTLLWLQNGVAFWNFLAIAPFLYILLMGATSIGVPIVLSLKVMSPLLLGFLGLSVFLYAKRVLSWSPKKSLLAVFFATLYFVALRVSWDMLRTEIGLIFFFVTLILLKEEGRSIKKGILLSFSMLAVVFAHQLVSVLMFAIVLATIARFCLDKKIFELRRLIIFSVPSLCLFFVVVFANYLVSPQFSIASGFLGQESEGFLALFGFSSYIDMVADTIGFLAFCYLPIIPFVLLGIKKFKSNLQLKVWVFWILLSLSLTIVSPNAFFAVYPYRWTLLLVYPLAFYAVAGFANLKLNVHKVCVGLILAMFSLGLIVLPNNLAFPYYACYSNYVPTSMLQNTVALSEAKDTVTALQWVQNNMPLNANLLVHDVFYGWSLLSLNDDQLISYGYANPETKAKKLFKNDSTCQLYLIWWINGSGWHGQPNVSSAFSPVYESGKIAIFIYKSSYSSTATYLESAKILNLQTDYSKRNYHSRMNNYCLKDFVKLKC